MSIRQKYKTTEIGEIPEDWEVVRLEEIATRFISGGTPSTSNPDYWNGNIPWMKSAWIKRRLVDSGEKYITKEGLRNSATNIVPQDNLLIATRVCIGNVAINKIDIAISQDLTGVVIKKSKAYPEYVYWALRNSENKVKQLVQGSTIKGVLREDLEKIKITRPSLPEQRKIATILSTVDEAIQKTDEGIWKTEILKRGLMQRLLTRGIGHTNFRQTELGEIPETWNIRKMGDNRIAKIIMGQSPSSSSYNTDGEGLPFLQGKAEFGRIYPSPQIYTKTPQKIAERNDVLVSVRAPVGELNITPFKCCIGRGLAAIRPQNSMLNTLFIFYYLKQNIRRLLRLQTGSTFKAIRKNDLSEFKVFVPHVSEQKKIADFLATCDKKIGTELNKKTQLESLKKGLMQVLLTGKVRVKVD